MRPIGFSTGALARGDVRTGLRLQEGLGVTAIELSALRENELRPLLALLPALDLTSMRWVSVHAPSRLRSMGEEEAVQLLATLPVSWPIIVHPNVIKDPSVWSALGERLCLENMDERKPVGRTAAELEMSFRALPHAGFCLDFGHARQIDPTLGVAMGLLRSFGDRLRQIHISELDFDSRHIPLGFASRESVRRLLSIIDAECPMIIESVVEGAEIARELEIVRSLSALSPAIATG